MTEDKRKETEPAPPPGEGDSLEDAAREAAEALERRSDGEGHAGAGDIG
jgi:hypothetical protein